MAVIPRVLSLPPVPFPQLTQHLSPPCQGTSPNTAARLSCRQDPRSAGRARLGELSGSGSASLVLGHPCSTDMPGSFKGGSRLQAEPEVTQGGGSTGADMLPLPNRGRLDSGPPGFLAVVQVLGGRAAVVWSEPGQQWLSSDTAQWAKVSTSEQALDESPPPSSPRSQRRGQGMMLIRSTQSESRPRPQLQEGHFIRGNPTGVWEAFAGFFPPRFPEGSLVISKL